MTKRNNGYYLTYLGRPYCDHMGCMAGQSLVKESGVIQCSYATRAEAIKARSTLLACGANTIIHSGVCPSKGVFPMTTTRQHFELIAGSIAALDPHREYTPDEVAAHFARHLALTNPSFNPQRFLRACGVTDA